MEQERQEKLFITFSSEEEIMRFVDVCSECDDAIDIKADKKSMDAKSIMGMLLMKLGEPLEIDYGCYDDEDNYQEFRNRIVSEFAVKVVPAPAAD